MGRRDDPVAISPLAVPQLAVGGSGDVLSGCLGALLAQGMESFQATCAAVLLHGHAGQDLAARFPCRGNSASEIAAALPHVRPDIPKR